MKGGMKLKRSSGRLPCWQLAGWLLDPDLNAGEVYRECGEWRVPWRSSPHGKQRQHGTTRHNTAQHGKHHTTPHKGGEKSRQERQCPGSDRMDRQPSCPTRNGFEAFAARLRKVRSDFLSKSSATPAATSYREDGPQAYARIRAYGPVWNDCDCAHHVDLFVGRLVLGLLRSGPRRSPRDHQLGKPGFGRHR